MSVSFKINKKDENLTWQTVFERIDRGFELQKKEKIIESNDVLKFNDAIVIDPDYQREYRSTVFDESSLIESALIDIPIPPIFLATQKFKGIQVLNVVDGQHRLRAFYRFFKNDFQLKGLQLLPSLSDKSFKELEPDDQTKLYSGNITCITFRDFPGKDFELEIFRRYNKGTKPLTAQEIRHAVYDSPINDLVNGFCKKLMDDPKSELGKAYAISKDRFQKKNMQENIFVILSIIENGVQQSFINDQDKNQKVTKSPQFAEVFMKHKSEKSSETENTISENNLKEFNSFVKYLTKLTIYPFSREIYGVAQRGNKFQVSISMILAGVFRKLRDDNFNFKRFEDEDEIKRFGNYLKGFLSDSYLEDLEYNASTTNPVKINDLVNSFSYK